MVEGNGEEGILMTGGSPNLVLDTASVVTQNGRTGGGFPGINVIKGALALTNVTVRVTGRRASRSTAAAASSTV